MRRFTKFQAHLGAQTISGINEVDRIIIDTIESYVNEEYDPQLIKNDIAFVYIDDYTPNGKARKIKYLHLMMGNT
jgi:hypothetical protein